MSAKTVLNYLDRACSIYNDKIAFADQKASLTYADLAISAKHVAMELIGLGFHNKPVAVYMEKSVSCIVAYYGVLYSGNFYSPLDVDMPLARVEKIFDTLTPQAVITDRKHAEAIQRLCEKTPIIIYEETQNSFLNEAALDAAKSGITDLNPMYVLFTSGSTGTPKGVVISHRALVDFVEWAANQYCFDENTVFANQTPFYFSMSIWDLFVTVYCGGTCHIIPHELFMFAKDLMTYINDRKVTTLVWVPSALTLVVRLKGLKKIHVDSLKTVLFGGEVMPIKQLNKWIEEYPNVDFVNIYGPTEVTDTFTAYTVNRALEETEALPIGEPRTNHEILILNEENQMCTDSEIGELCVRGTGLASGYYNAPEQTKRAFVQNPINTAYPDIIYRTGDLVKYNDYGELVYVARKDNQIKHMGHRIELGEIETALSSIDGIEAGCCVYDNVKMRIVAYYMGTIEGEPLMQELKTLLPEYMVPNVRIKLDEMPYNLNGKIDRAKLKEMMKERV